MQTNIEHPFYYVLNLGISLVIPTFSALIAQNADPRKMGEVMGIGDSIISICNAIMPVVSATLYGLLGARFYWLMALLPLLALGLSQRLPSAEPAGGAPSSGSKT